MPRLRGAPLALLVAAVAVALAAPARADALRVQFSTRVAAGERPKLVLIANEDVGPITVALTDGAGKPVSASIPRLRAGEKHELGLSGAPGRQRYQGQITVGSGPSAEQRPLTFETVVAPRLEVAIDRARVDLAGGRLEARLNRPADKVEILVVPISMAGKAPRAPIKTEQDLRGQPSDPLVVTLPALAESEIARIDLRFYDVDGFYTGVELHPWKMFIPHEEVTFATDSAEITAGERPKLEASLAKIGDAFARARGLGAVRLYVAGHTDTVGSAEHNLRLSRARAAAIAGWFRRHGLRLPIRFEGFGEHALAVATADETPEAKNRRVDYILALEDPPLGQGSFRAAWKPVP